MSEEAERRYLNEAAITLPEEDWCNGDRLWFRDFIAPLWPRARHVPPVTRRDFPASHGPFSLASR